MAEQIKQVIEFKIDSINDIESGILYRLSIKYGAPIGYVNTAVGTMEQFENIEWKYIDFKDRINIDKFKEMLHMFITEIK